KCGPRPEEHGRKAVRLEGRPRESTRPSAILRDARALRTRAPQDEVETCGGPDARVKRTAVCHVTPRTLRWRNVGRMMRSIIHKRCANRHRAPGQENRGRALPIRDCR